MMFCNKCGMSVTEGSKFCLSCGFPLPTVPLSASPPPGAPQARKKEGSTFFSSPAGIAVIAIISAVIIAGIVIGAIFATRAGTGSTSEDEITKVWNEYENIVGEADKDIGTIDLTSTALAKSREDLKKTREKVEALESVLKATKVPTNNIWKERYGQLAGTLRYYDRYITKLDDLYLTLAEGALNTQLKAVETKLNELKTLAAEVKTLANKFLENNNAVATRDFDPAILKEPTAIATELEKIIKGQPTTEGDNTPPATTETDETTTALARATLEKVLALYAGGNWDAITGFMTPALLQAYRNAPVPWGQVSYEITSNEIQSENVIGPNTINFKVLEKRDEFGDQYEGLVEWQMTKSGDAWQVNNYTSEDGYSKQ